MDPAGWAHIRAHAHRRAAVLAPGRRAVAAPPVRRHRGRAAPTSRCCTCAGTRPTRTPAGPGAGCPPRPSGRRRPGTTRRRGRSARYPWGDADPTPEHANLGQRHLRPAPAGSYPAGASPLGVRQLIGDVWEWTSSDFLPYPGFVAFPYREYSEVFFGADHKVLRGGSFAVDAVACRGTFRNWDYPIRRQIFSGFRTARDGIRPDVPSPGLPRARRNRSVALLIEPPHSLYRQSWAPRRQRHGTVNADGFGVGWYADGDPVPARYRRAGPIWARRVARRPGPGGALRRAARRRAGRDRGGRGRRGRGGAVRRGAVAVQPQRRGRRLARFAGARSRRACPPADLLSLEARCDSAFVWALVLHRLRGGDTAGQALADTVAGGRRGGPRLPAQPAAHRRRDDRRDRLGRHPVVPRRARPSHRRGLRTVRRRPALAGGPRPHPAHREPHRGAAHPAQGSGRRPGHPLTSRSPARESVPAHPHPARGRHRGRTARRRPRKA